MLFSYMFQTKYSPCFIAVCHEHTARGIGCNTSFFLFSSLLQALRYGEEITTSPLFSVDIKHKVWTSISSHLLLSYRITKNFREFRGF